MVQSPTARHDTEPPENTAEDRAAWPGISVASCQLPPVSVTPNPASCPEPPRAVPMTVQSPTAGHDTELRDQVLGSAGALRLARPGTGSGLLQMPLISSRMNGG